MGDRVVAPDLIGFGKSDKPKKARFHTFASHRQVLVELVEALDLRNIVLVFPERQSPLGLTLPMASPNRYQGLRLIDTEDRFNEVECSLGGGFTLWKQAMRRRGDKNFLQSVEFNSTSSKNQIDPGCDAPFPAKSYRAGSLAFPAMEAISDDTENLKVFRETERFWTLQIESQMPATKLDPAG
jgi:tRNA(adenine34) deaminase